MDEGFAVDEDTLICSRGGLEMEDQELVVSVIEEDVSKWHGGENGKLGAVDSEMGGEGEVSHTEGIALERAVKELVG